ncbi:MAG: transcriptional regulator [Desulfitobacterium sp.]|nr:transcriptional regulator [Desulfitobacterium sp.]
MFTQESLDLQNQLLNTLLLGGGFKELIKKASTVLGHDIFFTNPTQRIMVSSNTDNAFVEGTVITVTPLSPPVPGRVQIHVEDESIEALVLELSNSNKRLGFLFLANPGEDKENRLKILFHQVRSLFVLELQKQVEIEANNRQYGDAFLYDLLYGNMEEDGDIIARGKIWGWDLSLPHVVCVFELMDYESYSQDHYLIKHLLETAELVLTPLNKHYMLMDKHEEVILILPIKERRRRDKKAYLEMLINQILDKADDFLASREVRVGIGHKYDKPSELFRSYQEAKVAVKLGGLIKNKGSSIHFGELGVERILYSHDKQELQEFYLEVLSELESHDKQKNELMETLEKYLINNFDLKSTANALFLHPNSLRYRLKRIEEILDFDLEDFDVRVSLVIAFKIKHILDYKE